MEEAYLEQRIEQTASYYKLEEDCVFLINSLLFNQRVASTSKSNESVRQSDEEILEELESLAGIASRYTDPKGVLKILDISFGTYSRKLRKSQVKTFFSRFYSYDRASAGRSMTDAHDFDARLRCFVDSLKEEKREAVATKSYGERHLRQTYSGLLGAYVPDNGELRSILDEVFNHFLDAGRTSELDCLELRCVPKIAMRYIRPEDAASALLEAMPPYLGSNRRNGLQELDKAEMKTTGRDINGLKERIMVFLIPREP